MVWSILLTVKQVIIQAQHPSCNHPNFIVHGASWIRNFLSKSLDYNFDQQGLPNLPPRKSTLPDCWAFTFFTWRLFQRKFPLITMGIRFLLPVLHKHTTILGVLIGED